MKFCARRFPYDEVNTFAFRLLGLAMVSVQFKVINPKMAHFIRSKDKRFPWLRWPHGTSSPKSPLAADYIDFAKQGRR